MRGGGNVVVVGSWSLWNDDASRDNRAMASEATRFVVVPAATVGVDDIWGGGQQQMIRPPTLVR